VDRRGDYTLQVGDRRHDFRTNGTFELPIGPGQALFRNSSGLVARVIEGWKLSWIIQLTSGAPANLAAQSMLYGNGTPDIAGKFVASDGHVSWQNGAANGNYFEDVYKKVTDPQCASTAATLRSLCTLTAVADASGNVVLQNPLPGARGTLGQNAIEMPGTWSFDSGFGKRFRINETKGLTVRMDATNIFNHPQPANPNLDINSNVPFGNMRQRRVTGRSRLRCAWNSDGQFA
jgi:hypothetical protein